MFFSRLDRARLEHVQDMLVHHSTHVNDLDRRVEQVAALLVQMHNKQSQIADLLINISKAQSAAPRQPSRTFP